MHRRGYLGAVVAAGSTALAGCGALSGLTNSLPQDGPDGATVDFFQALNEGDIDEANEYIPDAAGSVADSMGERTLQEIEETDYTIEGTEVVEENDDEATVDLTYSVEGTDETRVEQFELVRNDDEWVITGSQDG